MACQHDMQSLTCLLQNEISLEITDYDRFVPSTKRFCIQQMIDGARRDQYTCSVQLMNDVTRIVDAAKMYHGSQGAIFGRSGKHQCLKQLSTVYAVICFLDLQLQNLHYIPR